MVSTRKRKHQNKKFLRHLNKTLSDCVIDNNTQGGVNEDEFLGRQNDCLLTFSKVQHSVKLFPVRINYLKAISPKGLEKNRQQRCRRQNLRP